MFNSDISSQIPALLLALGAKNERLEAKCLWLLCFSLAIFGDSLFLMEHGQVARGFDFLGASPYSPISDFGNNPSANRQLSMFISSCFSDVETIFSTAENHEDME